MSRRPEVLVWARDSIRELWEFLTCLLGDNDMPLTQRTVLKLRRTSRQKVQAFITRSKMLRRLDSDKPYLNLLTPTEVGQLVAIENSLIVQLSDRVPVS